MLIELSKPKLEATLITRKNRFNKYRVSNGKVTLADLLQEKKTTSVEKETIELSPLEEKAKTTEKDTIEFNPVIEKSEDKKENTKESKVVKLETSTGEVRTYNQQFKGGYFGRRKRF